jgi:hypothetical protein
MFGKEIVVGGLQLATFIILLVQTAKFLGMVGEAQLKWTVVVGAVVFVALSMIEEFVPGAAVYVERIAEGLWAIVAAVLGWAYGVKPLAQKLGIIATVSDLEG